MVLFKAGRLVILVVVRLLLGCADERDLFVKMCAWMSVCDNDVVEGVMERGMGWEKTVCGFGQNV